MPRTSGSSVTSATSAAGRSPRASPAPSRSRPLRTAGSSACARRLASKPEPLVEPARPVVVGAHLEEHLAAAALGGLVEQRGQQRRADPAALQLRAYADGQHVALAARRRPARPSRRSRRRPRRGRSAGCRPGRPARRGSISSDQASSGNSSVLQLQHAGQVVDGHLAEPSSRRHPLARPGLARRRAGAGRAARAAAARVRRRRTAARPPARRSRRADGSAGASPLSTSG